MATLNQRAAAGLPLNPQERAFLKLLSGWTMDGVIAALGVVAIVLSQANPVITKGTIALVLGAFLKSFLMAGSKWLSARNEPQAIAAAPLVAQIANDVGNLTGLNEPKQGVVLPPVQQSTSGTINTAPLPDGTTVTLS